MATTTTTKTYSIDTSGASDATKLISSLSDAASKIASKFNTASQASLQTTIKSMLPNWDTISSKISSNISSLLSGNLPADVASQTRQLANELNLSQGRYGLAASASTLQAVGSTSLEAMYKGTDMANSFLATIKNMTAGSTTDGASVFSDLLGKVLSYDSSRRSTSSQVATTTRGQDLDYALQSAAQALQKTQITNDMTKFNSALSWEKELSKFNTTFSLWQASQNQALANTVMSQKNYASSQQSAAMSQAYNNISSRLASSQY